MSKGSPGKDTYNSSPNTEPDETPDQVGKEVKRHRVWLGAHKQNDIGKPDSKESQKHPQTQNDINLWFFMFGFF